MDPVILLGLACCFGLFTVGLAQQAAYGGGTAYDGGSYEAAPPSYGTAPAPAPAPYGAAPAPSSYGSSYDSSYTSDYKYPAYQGSGVYFKKPVPIDEKPIFFRTPYWLPNMYYGHYGYPWTQWFDGGPRYVIPIMSAYPKGGGHTQSYNQGYGYKDMGSAGIAGGASSAGYGQSSGYGPSTAYGGGSSYAADGQYTTPDSVSTTDPYNDNFSYYHGIPMYQTYYERYLLKKANEATAAPAK